MLHLLFILISYGSLIILLMPATNEGIVSAVVTFILGAGIIMYKKPNKVSFWKDKRYSILLISILIVSYFGFTFYSRWLPSSKIRYIADIIHMPVEAVLLVSSIIFSLFTVYFFCIALQIIEKKLSDANPKNQLVYCLMYFACAAAITVILAQLMIGVEIFSMGFVRFLWAVLVVTVAILFVYVISGRIIVSAFIGAGIFMVISTVNAYVYQFRGRLFEPVDIFSTQTAMNVADNYNLFPIPAAILCSWCIFAAVLIFFAVLRRESGVKLNPNAKTRCIMLAICLISVVGISFYAANLKTYHWDREGAMYNGYILDFVSKFKEISVSEPDNYSTELIDQLADEYATNKNNTTADENSKLPHIIVIMDEAFSDLSVLGEFSTNTEVAPFISSLKENTVFGYALSSVYGGNTANSEYEFLTGNSLAWLSPNVVPYQQYIRSSTYSMVSYLKLLYDYTCIAMHPYQSSGWNRPSAYGDLGFDKCYFIEDFPQENYVRNYISDREMFEFLVETYEAEKENPLFLFGVTMQNHGGYEYVGENYTQHISLDEYGEQYPEIEQYLSLLYETDKAVEYLITYFQNVDEDVIIVFFGDHQPSISDSFYQTISETTEDILDARQNLYKIPFFVWANYDIEEEYVECTSLNYLSSYVYDAAGIPLPAYNRFLRELEAIIPSINANGFYSISSGHYLSFDEADGDELNWLKLYEALQYNCIFDKTNRNKTFFPTLG